jgi:hypothetical protein
MLICKYALSLNATFWAKRELTRHQQLKPTATNDMDSLGEGVTVIPQKNIIFLSC